MFLAVPEGATDGRIDENSCDLGAKSYEGFEWSEGTSLNFASFTSSYAVGSVFLVSGGGSVPDILGFFLSPEMYRRAPTTTR
jgi:hypothetical protein